MPRSDKKRFALIALNPERVASVYCPAVGNFPPSRPGAPILCVYEALQKREFPCISCG